MSYISANLNFLMTVIKKAGTSLSRDFSEIEQLQSSVKGHKEFVNTAVARAANSLRVELQKGRPNYAVVFEGEAQPQAPHFLVSVLDGIANFTHGIPYFAVSIAVVENGSVTSGVIYNPATSDLYFAEKGQGAFKEGFRNHERLRVSARKDLNEALIGAGRKLNLPETLACREFGSLSLDLAYAASGRLDGVVAKGASAAVFAAGIFLVAEAGGYAYEFNQKDIRSADMASVLASGNLIAGNPEVSRKLHGLVNK